MQPVGAASLLEKAIVNDQAKVQARIKKLSYKLQKEFDDLPKLIETFEQTVTSLKMQIAAVDFYTQAQKFREEKLQALAQAELQLENCFERWAELEDMQQSE